MEQLLKENLRQCSWTQETEEKNGEKFIIGRGIRESIQEISTVARIHLHFCTLVRL